MRTGRNYKRPELEYIADEGFVRLNLRRPVNLYVPTEQQEGYDPDADGQEPSSTLELEWVYGYRGRDCRNNLYVLGSGEVVYFAAAAAVVYNVEEGTQRHFLEHNDDIKCIAVHPDGKIVATGQIQGRGDTKAPHVRVWNSETLETLAHFGADDFDRGVSAVSFSEDGNQLCAVDEAQEPQLSVWNWREKEKLAQIKAAGDPIIGTFFSREPEPRPVTCGKNHLAFWTFSGNSLDRRTGIFGGVEKPKFVTSLTSLSTGDIVTGDTNGNVLVWEIGGNTISRIVEKVHAGPVLHVGRQTDGTFITCGKDGFVKKYDHSLENTDSIHIAEEFGWPRVAVSVGDALIIATTNNAIVKSAFGSEDPPEIITQGHQEEIWGLGTSATSAHFVTAGEDGKIYLRDSENHAIIWKKSVDIGLRSVDICGDDSIVAIGSMSAKWFIIDLDSQEVLHEGEDGDEAIQACRFSPSGDKLALGSRDNKIYIYNIADGGKEVEKLGDCSGHSSFITHLDWSSDGAMIRTNSGDYEVLYWNISDCSQESQNENYRDVNWATANCILAFDTVGIWPPGTDGTDINGANKGREKGLIASGDDFGSVKLFSYPSTVHNAPHGAYHAHSSHVTSVAFIQSDNHVISTGGRDATVMQWKVVNKEVEEE